MVIFAGLDEHPRHHLPDHRQDPHHRHHPEGLNWLGAGRIAGVLVVGGSSSCSRSSPDCSCAAPLAGEYVYATGSNPDAARLSGLPVKPVQIARVRRLRHVGRPVPRTPDRAARPSASRSRLRGWSSAPSPPSCRGGTSLFVGKGRVPGTFIAVLRLSVLSNVGNLMGLSSYFQQLVTGLILVDGPDPQPHLGTNAGRAHEHARHRRSDYRRAR